MVILILWLFIVKSIVYVDLYETRVNTSLCIQTACHIKDQYSSDYNLNECSIHMFCNNICKNAYLIIVFNIIFKYDYENDVKICHYKETA